MPRRRSGAAPRLAAALLALLACAAVSAAADAPDARNTVAASLAAAAAPAFAPGTGRLEQAAALSLEESGMCTYKWQPPSHDANTSATQPLTWVLNRGAGAHARGLVASAGFHRVDVGHGEAATSFFFQARAQANRTNPD